MEVFELTLTTRKVKRMKQRFRMFRRGNYFWSHDGQTGKQETLHTKDKAAGRRLLHAKNEAHQQPVFNLQIARTYLAASDPQIVKRTWRTAIDVTSLFRAG